MTTSVCRESISPGGLVVPYSLTAHVSIPTEGYVSYIVRWQKQRPTVIITLAEEKNVFKFDHKGTLSFVPGVFFPATYGAETIQHYQADDVALPFFSKILINADTCCVHVGPVFNADLLYSTGAWSKVRINSDSYFASLRTAVLYQYGIADEPEFTGVSA